MGVWRVLFRITIFLFFDRFTPPLAFKVYAIDFQGRFGLGLGAYTIRGIVLLTLTITLCIVLVCCVWMFHYFFLSDAGPLALMSLRIAPLTQPRLLLLRPPNGCFSQQIMLLSRPILEKAASVADQDWGEARLSLKLIALLLDHLDFELKLLAKDIESVLEHLNEDFGELHLHLF